MAVHAKLEHHGRHIYIYCHVRTKQVIYSLTRAMDNHSALKQLPFLGKQTVPNHLRKDFWRPMATVTFPNGHQGLEAYRQLREFRIRHEHEWTAAEVGARVFIDRRLDIDLKAAAKRVQNQKSNSIADLAFVLAKQKEIAEVAEEVDREAKGKIDSAIKEAQERIPFIKEEMSAAMRKARSGDEKALKLYKSLKRQKMRIPRALAKPRPDKYLARKYDPLNDKSLMPKVGPRRQMRLAARVPAFSTESVRVAWADLQDAEYAAEWPDNVAHDALKHADRHVAPRGRIRPQLTDSSQDLEDASEEATELPQNQEPLPRSTDKIQVPPPEDQTWTQRLLVRLRDGAQ